jgi:hypothetical protein
MIRKDFKDTRMVKWISTKNIEWKSAIEVVEEELKKSM